MKQLLKVREAAKILGVSDATIYRIIERGDLKASIINERSNGKKDKRIHVEDLKKYINKIRHRGAAWVIH